MHRPKARQGKALKSIENPGEHRVPGGLNRHLETTDSQGEKGPEDEPLSQAVAWPCLFRCAPDFGLERARAGQRLVWKHDTDLRVGGTPTVHGPSVRRIRLEPSSRPKRQRDRTRFSIFHRVALRRPTADGGVTGVLTDVWSGLRTLPRELALLRG
jgi:hypothetical protein